MLIQLAGEHLGILPLYIEKDYFVVFALKQLANSPYVKNGIFKGGTSLSKAYKLIERFSEDIDLAVVDDEGKGIGKRPLMRSIEKCMTRSPEFAELSSSEDLRVHKQSRFRRSVHKYPRVIESNDFGQATNVLLLEINRYTPPFPYESLPIQSYIADFLEATGQQAVITEYGLESIAVNVLGVERTFSEKILGMVKRSCGENPIHELSDKIRHIYDLHFLTRNLKVKKFLAAKSQVPPIYSFSLFREIIEDEARSLDPNNHDEKWLDAPFANCLLFRDTEEIWEQLAPTYHGVFSRLVYGKKPEPGEIKSSLAEIRIFLERFDAWKVGMGCNFRDLVPKIAA